MFNEEVKLYRVIDEDGNIIGTTRYFDPINDKRKKIALVVGHDSKRQGAYGNAGISEYRFNAELIQAIRAQCQNLNIEVFYRDEKIKGYSNQMNDLHKRIDESCFDVSIEFHFNSFSDENVTGHEVLFCVSSKNGKTEAIKLNSTLDKYLPTSNRGIKAVSASDRGGGFCCRGKSTAILVESFFGSNQHKFIHGGEFRKNLINAISEYIRNS